ncbi:MAG: hypothetical protein PHF57_12645 [Methanoregula sp.]|nr:hypothetical protein [Methanoregula sp.]
MEVESIHHEDVGEPDQVVSGSAGTGQTHGIETGKSGKPDGNSPHVTHEHGVIGPGVLYNGKILPAQSGKRHTCLLLHGESQRVTAIGYSPFLTGRTVSGTRYRKRSTGSISGSQNPKTGGDRNERTNVSQGPDREENLPVRSAAQKIRRPETIAMTTRRSKSETDIPHYRIPSVTARQIRERGDDVYRISVKRTRWHHYLITVRTKSRYRELRVREDSCSARQPTGNADNNTRDESSGGAA